MWSMSCDLQASEGAWNAVPGNLTGYRKGDRQFLVDEMVVGVPRRIGSEVTVALINRRSELKIFSLVEHHPDIDESAIRPEISR